MMSSGNIEAEIYLLNDNATKYQKIDMLNLITELKGSRITILANKNADKAFIDQITYFANTENKVIVIQNEEIANGFKVIIEEE